jgi:hypothetical protein
MTFDNQCNLWISTDDLKVYRFNFNTITPSVVATFAAATRGIVYHPGSDRLIVSVKDRLYTLTKNGVTKELAGSQVGQYLNALAIAPPGWGSYAGHIIGVHSGGSVYAFDLQNSVPKVVASTTGPLSDLIVIQQQPVKLVQFTE